MPRSISTHWLLAKATAGLTRRLVTGEFSASVSLENLKSETLSFDMADDESGLSIRDGHSKTTELAVYHQELQPERTRLQ